MSQSLCFKSKMFGIGLKPLKSICASVHSISKSCFYGLRFPGIFLWIFKISKNPVYIHISYISFHAFLASLLFAHKWVLPSQAPVMLNNCHYFFYKYPENTFFLLKNFCSDIKYIQTLWIRLVYRVFRNVE